MHYLTFRKLSKFRILKLIWTQGCQNEGLWTCNFLRLHEIMYKHYSLSQQHEQEWREGSVSTPGVQRPEGGAAVQSGGQDGQKGLGRSQDQHCGAESTVTARRLLRELWGSKEGPFC